MRLWPRPLPRRPADMARGSIQPRHRKACLAKGWDRRVCTCGPTVYAVLNKEWVKLGYLDEGWRKADLQPYTRRLAEMRAAQEAGASFKPVKPVTLAEYASGWFSELWAAAEAGRISKLTYNAY